jgi:hypothetical protein
MSEALSFAEIDGQQVELLPARIVLSLFASRAPGTAIPGSNGAHGSGAGGGKGGLGGMALAGLSFNWMSGPGASAGTATGGAGGST